MRVGAERLGQIHTPVPEPIGSKDGSLKRDRILLPGPAHRRKSQAVMILHRGDSFHVRSRSLDIDMRPSRFQT